MKCIIHKLENYTINKWNNKIFVKKRQQIKPDHNKRRMRICVELELVALRITLSHLSLAPQQILLNCVKYCGVFVYEAELSHLVGAVCVFFIAFGPAHANNNAAVYDIRCGIGATFSTFNGSSFYFSYCIKHCTLLHLCSIRWI